MTGLHLIAEFYGCRCAALLLETVDQLRALCLKSCARPGLHAVGNVFHQFTPVGSNTPCGATGVVILAESHLAVHTWPESRAVTLDLYVCNFSQDNQNAARAAFRELEAAFQPTHITYREIERGLPAPDIKPLQAQHNPNTSSYFSKDVNMTLPTPPSLDHSKCIRCGADFTCGALAGEAHCWCMEIPIVLPLPDTGESAGCYCPECLKQLSKDASISAR